MKIMVSFDDEDLKGTTAVAICTKDGVFAAVDSRASREWIPKESRKVDWYPKNTAKKAAKVSTKIMCLKVGNARDCEKMWDDVDKALKPLEDNGDEINVSYVADLVYNYMDGIRDQSKSFGTIIIGHDDTKQFQIYRIFIKDKIVENKQNQEIATMGSGYGFANDILVYSFDFNMSPADALILVTKAVSHGLFYDKNSGGSIHAFYLSNVGIYTNKPRRASLAYLDTFEFYDPGRILFMIYEIKDRDKAKLLSTDHFVNLFRLDGDILVAHRVDERKSHDFKFFFHRLVFTNREEVGKVLSSPQMKKYVHKVSDAPILSKFSYNLNLVVGGKIGSLTLFIEEASKELLEYLIKRCPIQNAWRA